MFGGRLDSAGSHSMRLATTASLCAGLLNSSEMTVGHDTDPDIGIDPGGREDGPARMVRWRMHTKSSSIAMTW